MLATGNTITSFIPQRPPMVMVHNLVEASEDHAVTQLLIGHENIFLKDGEFQEPGLVENIAQTGAVQLGYIFTKKKLPIPIGFIASVKDLKIYKLPSENSLITTSIKVVNKVMNITIIKGNVTCNGDMICECEIRIFVNK